MEQEQINKGGPKKGLKIVHLNARSVLNKIDDIRQNLGSFDIVSITETWLDESVTAATLAWKGYNMVRVDRKTYRNKRGGGICIYLKTYIVYEMVGNQESFIDGNIEYMYLLVKVPNQKPVDFILVYRPPDGTDNEFVNKLCKLIKPLNRERNNIDILGDFNIFLKNNKNMESSGLSKLEGKYTLQIITSPTRVTSNTNRLIDLLYTDMSTKSQGGTLNYNISDHLSIFLIKKKIRNKIVKTQVSGRSYMRYRKEAFIEALGGMDWDRYENIEDPNLLWEMFLGNITSVLDQTCPIRVLNVVNSTPKWLTNTILRKNEGQGQSL